MTYLIVRRGTQYEGRTGQSERTRDKEGQTENGEIVANKRERRDRERTTDKRGPSSITAQHPTTDVRPFVHPPMWTTVHHTMLRYHTGFVVGFKRLPPEE